MNNETYETAKRLQARIRWLEKVMQQLDEASSDPSNFILDIHSGGSYIATPAQDKDSLYDLIVLYFEAQYENAISNFNNL